MRRATSSAMRCCSAVHRPWRATKESGDLLGESIQPARAFALLRLAPLPIALPIVGRADAVDSGRAGDARSGSLVERRDRLLTRLLERAAQQPAIGDDRLVRRA